MKKNLSLILAIAMLLSLSVFVPSFAEEVYKNDGWVVSVNSEISPKLGIENVFDGDYDTMWHTKYTAEGSTITHKDAPPYIINVDFGKGLEIGAIRYVPRQAASGESSAGNWEEAVFYGSANGADFEEIGKSTYDISPNRESVTTNVKKGVYKAIKISVNKGRGGFGSAAEVEFLGSGVVVKEDKPKTVLEDKTSWTIEASSVIREGLHMRAFDGDAATYWHSNYTHENGVVTWKESPPYYITVTYPENVLISGFTYLPRQDAASGRFDKAELYASETLDGELIKIKDWALDASAGLKTAEFVSNLNVRKFQIKIVQSAGVGTAAEFDFLPAKEGAETISISDYVKYEEETKLYPVSKDGFAIESDSPFWIGYNASNIIDDSAKTFWQTEGISVAPSPWEFTIDMKKERRISAFSYTPRNTNDMHGAWKAYEVEVSKDGENFECIHTEYEWKPSLEIRTVKFETPVTARYVKFSVIEANASRAACADITFYQTKAEFDAENTMEAEKYVLKIGDETIKVTKGEKTYDKKMDVAPFIDAASSSTLIPLRGLLEEMEAEITWKGESEEITVVTKSGRIEMQIQNNLVYVENPKYGMVRYTLPVVPKIKNSRTFIPLRFVSEHLGYKVSWNGETQEITIEK